MRAAREAQKTRAREKDAEEESRGHWTTKKRDDMTDRDWRIFREDFEIYIKVGRAGTAERSFPLWRGSSACTCAASRKRVALPEESLVQLLAFSLRSISFGLQQRWFESLADSGTVPSNA